MYDLILSLRSQIFEYLHSAFFCRRALGYLEPAAYKKKEEMKKWFLSRETPDHY